MDLSFATARAVGAELVIANDPDADRLAVAIPDAAAERAGGASAATRSGSLLGWRAARRAADAPGDSGPNGTLACSIVSSPGLEAVARAYGLDFEATLTGFKWISRAPRPRLRLRGGARLPREPRHRARQGRHLGRPSRSSRSPPS